jgi:hypothetical protein
MNKKLPENFNTENCRYVGDDDFGLYYFVTKKGWLKPLWYTTAVFRLREYILPKDWMTDRGPSSTEEKAWLVGKTVAEQLYEEWRPTWKETYLAMRDLWDSHDQG